jgi:hypothetical protein
MITCGICISMPSSGIMLRHLSSNKITSFISSTNKNLTIFNNKTISSQKFVIEHIFSEWKKYIRDIDEITVKNTVPTCGVFAGFDAEHNLTGWSCSRRLCRQIKARYFCQTNMNLTISKAYIFSETIQHNITENHENRKIP